MLDVLYLTHNRRAFTELTFQKLVENTNWDLVDHLIVYDDNSMDGALEEVTTRLPEVPVPWDLRKHDWGSPVAVMNDYVASTESDRFAKIDNDLAVPPGWLDAFVETMDADKSGVQLIGTESPFMGPPGEGWNGTYRVTPWRHIGGIGLMVTDFFRKTGPMGVDGYHGFTGHQWNYDPPRGWITPDLLVCLLDRCPVEPWKSLSEEYVNKGWQRRWGKMPGHFDMYWNWFTEQEEESE